MTHLHPLISICIPAYNRPKYLERLLKSIASQTFTSFEVIVTDDSPDNIIQLFLQKQTYNFPLRYVKNSKGLGTPRNWLEGMHYANAEWIKIMHDDDWFSTADSLSHFANAVNQNTDCIFSGYVAFFENKKKLINKTISQVKFSHIKSYPYYLFGDNIIGPPSVVMFRKGITELYDPQLKWLVDIEAYVRIIKKYNCIYVELPVITMSYNDTQVTNDCFRNPDVEIREALIYFHKNGDISRERLFAYDAWWRMLRNLNIRTNDQLHFYAKGEVVPSFLYKILAFQQNVPAVLLRQGMISKILMTISFLGNR